jgi:acetyltransferase-like isoleucine patch superfamily enzyme
VNCYLDLEIGAGALISDWVYICDFDHVMSDITVPIKDQGIVKTPVRIGPGCWLGVKSSVLRGTVIGADSVLAAHAVARGTYPDFSIIVGVPGRAIRDRAARYAAAAGDRAALADMARKHAEAAQQRLTEG